MKHKPYIYKHKIFIPIASALAIILLSFSSSFANHIQKSSEKLTLLEDENNTEMDSASVSWTISPVFEDSVDIVISVKISNPEEGEMIVLRYGTEDGSGDLIAMNLRIAKEDNEYSLVYDHLKFMIDERGYATIISRVEKAYLQQHDRYFILKLKDESGNEVKSISQIENH